VIHKSLPIAIEVTCEVELANVSIAEVDLIEASLGELIQAMFLNQDEG
jgi:hypothetical protein